METDMSEQERTRLDVLPPGSGAPAAVQVAVFAPSVR
jgi:hypothetical protein